MGLVAIRVKKAVLAAGPCSHPGPSTRPSLCSTNSRTEALEGRLAQILTGGLVANPAQRLAQLSWVAVHQGRGRSGSLASHTSPKIHAYKEPSGVLPGVRA